MEPTPDVTCGELARTPLEANEGDSDSEIDDGVYLTPYEIGTAIYIFTNHQTSHNCIIEKLMSSSVQLLRNILKQTTPILQRMSGLSMDLET
jgi:hypothetical protein